MIKFKSLFFVSLIMKSVAKKRGVKDNKLLLDGISALIILFGIFVLMSYYFNVYTKEVDIIIIVLTIILGIDCFVHVKHSKFGIKYSCLGALFIIVAITHSYRFFFGPLHCKTFANAISIYAYDGLAILVGMLMLYISLFLMHKRSGKRYHHIAGILVGLAMVINHIIKLIIGKCF